MTRKFYSQYTDRVKGYRIALAHMNEQWEKKEKIQQSKEASVMTRRVDGAFVRIGRLKEQHKRIKHANTDITAQEE